MDARTLEKKLNFINDYKKASNAATGSQVDSNANVTQKNLSTMTCELSKKDIIDIRRALMDGYLKLLYDEETAECYKSDLKDHIIYQNDETSLMPYCCSISLYPFVLNGLKQLGGTSGAPKHANSFIGGLINLVYMVASQFAGAVAIPEFLTYFDHFLRADYGDDYVDHLDDPLEVWGNIRSTLRDRIEDWMQQLVHSINEPAGARNYQSPFTNIAYFDEYYFHSIFKDFVFPDGDEPNWNSTKQLQRQFMQWFNMERNNAVLTFPVETANSLVENGDYKDQEQADFLAHMWAAGHSFFLYQSDSVDALASCCFVGDELIDVIDKRSNETYRMSIKDFCLAHSNDFSNYSIMSYNPDTNMQEQVDISGTLEKLNDHSMIIKIETEDGTTLKVTPEHVFLVKDLNSGNTLEIKAKDFVKSYSSYELLTC